MKKNNRHLIAALLFAFFAPMLSATDMSAKGAANVEYVAVGQMPFSSVVRVDNMLYLSGQIGFDVKKGGLVEGGVEDETRQVMENIKRVLTSQGSSMDKLLRCLVMLADMSEWPQMNAVYRGYFKNHYPARSAFGVNGLALGARVEIECTARAK